MLVDFNQHGKPIGIELIAPAMVTLDALNEALSDFGLQPLSAADLEPLHAP